MSTPFKLSIPKPCDASWDQMDLEKKSRRCNLCSQSVYELEEFEESQAVHLLQQKVCVRIKINADGNIKTRGGFSRILLMGGLLACGDTTGEPILEVESGNPVEVLQRTAGQPVHIDSKAVTQNDPPHPVMGKIAVSVNPQPEFNKMGEVEVIHEEMGEVEVVYEKQGEVTIETVQ